MVPNTPTPDTGATGYRLDSPAFPLVDHGEVLASGLTKRELFAAMALQGIASNPASDGYYADYASEAVKLADALVTALHQQN